jgi:hypothetical protein
VKKEHAITMHIKHLGLVLLASLALPIAASAQGDTATIENEFLVASLKDGQVGLYSKTLARMAVPALGLPAESNRFPSGPARIRSGALDRNCC